MRSYKGALYMGSYCCLLSDLCDSCWFEPKHFLEVIFLVFFFGSFSKAGLEALCPPVLRARLAGVLIGLTAVLLCYEIGTFSKTTEKGRY